ncbi:Flp pilus assembly protein TadB [Streptomyces africanus]|uniref:Flp pilus assembly protein TadB n=1 Tax=Streptomyces africanus TaxID=231024 RepID=A0ABU0QVN9_9ACTN|nr:Flp pilus assembly protein TadB [Streptomyces africanus]
MNNCTHNRSPKPWGLFPVLFIVAALLLLGFVLGTVAHAPLTFSVATGVVIAVWLGVFALRERHGRRRHTQAH